MKRGEYIIDDFLASLKEAAEEMEETKAEERGDSVAVMHQDTSSEFK